MGICGSREAKPTAGVSNKTIPDAVVVPPAGEVVPPKPLETTQTGKPPTDATGKPIDPTAVQLNFPNEKGLQPHADHHQHNIPTNPSKAQPSDNDPGLTDEQVKTLLSKVKLESPEVLKINSLPKGTIYCLQRSGNIPGTILSFSGASGTINNLSSKPNPECANKPKESFLVPPQDLIYMAAVDQTASVSKKSAVYGFLSNPSVLFCEDGTVLLDGVVIASHKFEALNGKGFSQVGSQLCVFRTEGGGLSQIDLRSRSVTPVEGVQNLADFTIDSEQNLNWISVSGEFHNQNLLQRKVLTSTLKLAKNLSVTSNHENPPSWHAISQLSSNRFISAGYHVTHPHANTYVLSTATGVVSSVSQEPKRNIDQCKFASNKHTTF